MVRSHMFLAVNPAIYRDTRIFLEGGWPQLPRIPARASKVGDPFGRVIPRIHQLVAAQNRPRPHKRKWLRDSVSLAAIAPACWVTDE